MLFKIQVSQVHSISLFISVVDMTSKGKTIAKGDLHVIMTEKERERDT
jgi:hypothetical protein